MTKKKLNHKSWYHVIQKCLSSASDALKNELKNKYSVEDYLNSVLKSKSWELTLSLAHYHWGVKKTILVSLAFMCC